MDKPGDRTMKSGKLTGLLVVVAIVGMLLIWQLYGYVSLSHSAKNALSELPEIDPSEQKIDLVGMIDSYGVPFAPSVDASFFDLTAQVLAEENRLSSSLDLFSLYTNKTWNVTGLFQTDITIGEYTALQNFGVDFVRHKYSSQQIKDDLSYSCEPELEDVSIRDYVGTLEHPVVVYSATANDLFFYYDVSLESLTFVKALNIIKNLSNGLDLIQAEVSRNIETIRGCNSNADIYVMGLYVPSDNFFLNRIGNILIDQINRRIEEVCSTQPNTHYVDVSCLSFYVLEGDFHPNQDGQQVLSNLLLAAIQQYHGEMEAQEVKNPVAAETTEAELLGVSGQQLAERIGENGLPATDYVECAVAIEQALQNFGWEAVSETELRSEEDAFLAAIEQDQSQQVDDFRKGFEILCIERTLLQGIDLSDYTIDPDFQNDKLSLIAYY
jgi:hypothetical protein